MSIKKDFADVSKQIHIAYLAAPKYKSVKKNKKIAEKTRNVLKTRNASSSIMCNEQAKGQGTRDKNKAKQDRTGQGGKTAKAWTAWAWAQKSPAGVNLRGDVYSLNDTIRYSITTAHAAIREARIKVAVMTLFPVS